MDTGTKLIISNSNFIFRINKILPKLNSEFKVLIIDENTLNGNIFGINEELMQASDKFQTVKTNLDQNSHFHFTSGSTKPKGVQHVHGAFENHLASFMEVMQPDDNDIYWCTADPGWVTGVTYGIITVDPRDHTNSS